MSDQISTATHTINSELTNCESNDVAKFFILFFCVIALTLIMMSMMSVDSITYQPIILAAVHENFNNASVENIQQNFQDIPLNVPQDLNDPPRIVFGKADKFQSKKSIDINISANLYVLNGNVYNQSSDDQGYPTYLSDGKTNKPIGDLKKDGDGIYKLTFSTDKVDEFSNFKIVQVFYRLKKDEMLLLHGSFK